MKQLFRNLSIRTRLSLLVVTAVLPTLAIIVYSAVEQQHVAMAVAEKDAFCQVENLADSQKFIEAGARQLLGALAELPEVRSRNAAACNRIFASMRRRFPDYVSLQAATPEGVVFASGEPLPAPVAVGDRKYFLDAVASGDFSPGGYIVGRITRRPMINYAMPVMDGDGRIVAVLQAGVGLDFLARSFSKAGLPDKGTLVVTDHAGTILFQHDSAQDMEGKKDDTRLFLAMQQAGSTGLLPGAASENPAPVRAFSAVRHNDTAPPYMYIRVTLPEESVYGPSRRGMLRNMFLLILATGMAMSVSRLMGKRSIAEPIERLAGLSRRMEEGDLTVRSGIEENWSEIGRLARAFDDMAAALAEREREMDGLIRNALEANAKIEAIIAAIGTGITIQDTDFRVIFQNQVHRAFMGDHKGRFCYEVYGHSPRVCDNCPVSMAYADGSVHTVERSMVREDGSRIDLEVTASPVRDADGRICAGVEVVRDITSRKRLENEILQSNQALEQSNRELRQFAYVASHDLREPLRTISSFIQLFRRRYEGKIDQDANEFIAFIVDGAARMQRLIDDLLLYSRVESKGRPFTPVDTGKVLDVVRANLGTAIAEAGAEVSSSPLPEVMGDENQLVQLFQNLLANAVKFRGEAPPRIEVACVRESTAWHFRVSDNGIGIDPDYFDRVFDIFQKLHTRDQFEGTGIGLSICKKIVERHGGRIWVDSAPGRGAVFHFTLPGVMA
jgi:signal transduction histidine kinase/HAMP domain-containing protein